MTDRVIAVVRRHVLGMEAERSAWAVLGRAALAVLAAAGKAVLYGLRLVLAPRSTVSGARRLVLLATPLPGTSSLGLALDPVRDALDGNLRDLREEHQSAFTALAGGLAAAQEEFRTELGGVREAVRTETQRRTGGSPYGGGRRGPVDARRGPRGARRGSSRAARAARRRRLEPGRRPSRRAGGVPYGDRERTGSGPYGDQRRTGNAPHGVDAVREAARAAEEQPPAVDRDAVVAELADQIRDADHAAETGGHRTTTR